MSAELTRLLDEMQARADAATEGPWVYIGRNVFDTPTIEVDEANWGGEDLTGYRLVCQGDSGAWRNADAEFIAAARTDLPRLIAAVRAVLDIPTLDEEERMVPQFVRQERHGYNKALVAAVTAVTAVAAALEVTR